MEIFKRHLNWTLVSPLIMMVVFVAMDAEIGNIVFRALALMCYLLPVIIAPWVSYQKGRGLGVILISPVMPVVALFVSNKRRSTNGEI